MYGIFWALKCFYAPGISQSPAASSGNHVISTPTYSTPADFAWILPSLALVTGGLGRRGGGGVDLLCAVWAEPFVQRLLVLAPDCVDEKQARYSVVFLGGVGTYLIRSSRPNRDLKARPELHVLVCVCVCVCVCVDSVF
jgi:hypothetical protein